MSTPAGFEPLSGLSPFAEHVGPLHRHADGRLGLRSDGRHANVTGKVQGGLLATLCDVAFGHAVREEGDDVQVAATVSLTVDYLAAATPGEWLEAHTNVERLGGRLAFAECAVTADGRPVVRSRAVFAVLD